MKLAIMQPYAFPYLGYFQLMSAVDRFVFLDDAQYITRGWINRNAILGPEGRPWRFTIPLKGASQSRRIDEIEISAEPPWQDKLLKTIERSYRKAPCFETAWPMIERLLLGAKGNLGEFIVETFRVLNGHLGIETPLVRSSAYGNRSLPGEQRILDICGREKATHYLNLPGGRDLYHAKNFAERGMRLSFLDTTPVSYPQFKAPFTEGLSIIDIIMFNDATALRQRLTEYRLIEADNLEPQSHG
jgi:hypothetical protein